jgi:hypothetical protein
MSTKFRNVLAVALAAVALAAGTAASAGAMDKAAEKLRQRSEQNSEQKPIAKPSQQPSAPRPREEPRGERPRGGSATAAPAPAPRDSGNGRGSRGEDRGGDRTTPPQGGGDRSPNRGANGNLRDDLARLQGKDPGNDRDRGGSWGRDRGDSRGDRNHNPRPPRVVERLPSGHRDYYWNGSRYYTYGGYWYRPYGSTFISVGIPFGLFVATLPGIYSSFWIGGTRYFYADHTYYVYEPVRRGYVVTRSPYGDDDEYNDTGAGDDLYIYPARGQSEQQQADDRYQCHRWAAQESDYDPLDDDYDADLRKDYQRAMTACLTGRGYTVN